MTKTRHTLRWIALTLTIGALGVAQASLRATDRQMVQAPRFEVDPVWPKPMPNHWILGSVIGVGRGYFASSRSTARRFFMILRAASIWVSNSGLYGVRRYPSTDSVR